MDIRNDGSQTPRSRLRGQTDHNNSGGANMMLLTTEMTTHREVVQMAVEAIQTWSTSRPAQAADSPRVRLAQPLLFLALGGTGRQLATRAKAELIERFGHVPENALFLAFDSAADPITVRTNRNGRVIELARDGEFFLLDRVPLLGIKRNLERHPDIAGRLGADLNRIHRTSIHDGTAQERPQGLLALMWNAPTVVRLLNNAVRRLVERSDDLRHAHDGRSGINVVLAGSSCGGQNSGAMFDLAYLTREALLGLGDLGESSRITGVVVLPAAFPGVRGPNFGPNTYAFFLELDALMQGAGFHASYPGNLRVDSTEPPFDTVFVLDGVDERGKAWANLEEVCDLGAQALMLLLTTDLGAREIFAALNELGVLHRVSPAGRGTYLATVGQAVIRFPAQQVADRCALRLAAAMAETCLTDTAAELPPTAALAGGEALRERLRLNAHGAPFQVSIVLPASVEQAPAEEQPGLARTLVVNYLQKRIYDEAFGQIKTTAGQLIADLIAELNSGLRSAVATGRATIVTNWLHRAHESLQAEYTRLLAEAERLAAEANSSQRALDAASSGLDQAAGAIFFLRKGQMRAALTRYLDAASQLARLRLEQRVAEAAAEVIYAGLREMRQRSQQASEAALRLTQVRDQLIAHEAELARRAISRSEINLASEELVVQLYAQHSSDPVALAPQVTALAGGLLEWGSLTPAALADHLVGLADGAFRPVRAITVEDVLGMRWDERSAQQWIGRLTDLAAAAWNLDRALLPDGGANQASFLTIGVPDATSSIFGNGGYSLVSTHDPERIVALRTIYGASFDTLKPAQGWQRDYEQAKTYTPVHVLPAASGQ